MQKRCQECKSSQIIHDKHSGDVICASCGLVLSERRLDDSQDRKISKDQTKPHIVHYEKKLLLSDLFSSEKKTRTQKKIIEIYYLIRSYSERLQIHQKISPILDIHIHKLINLKHFSVQDVQGFAKALLYLLCMDLGLAFVKEDFIHSSTDKTTLTAMISRAVDIYRGDLSVSANYYGNLLHRFCGELGIPYRSIYNLQLELDVLLADPCSHMLPLTAIGVLIARNYPSLPLEKISETVHITRNTLKKHLKK